MRARGKMTRFRFVAANFAEPRKKNTFRVDVFKLISPLILLRPELSQNFFEAGTMSLNLILKLNVLGEGRKNGE